MSSFSKSSKSLSVNIVDGDCFLTKKTVDFEWDGSCGLGCNCCSTYGNLLIRDLQKPWRRTIQELGPFEKGFRH